MPKDRYRVSRQALHGSDGGTIDVAELGLSPSGLSEPSSLPQRVLCTYIAECRGCILFLLGMTVYDLGKLSP